MSTYQPATDGSFAALCRNLLIETFPDASEDHVDRQVTDVLRGWDDTARPNIEASDSPQPDREPLASVFVFDRGSDAMLAVREVLHRAGYSVRHASTARQARDTVLEHQPDIFIADDRYLENDDVSALIDLVRQSDPAPLLAVLSHGDTPPTPWARWVHGSLTAPFTEADLLATMQTLLRRSGAGNSGWGSQGYDDGVLRLEPQTRRAYVRGELKSLTPTEYRLLSALVRHAGRPLPPRDLLAQAWDDPTGIGAERVKFAVLRLRRKLGWNDEGQSRIQSLGTRGYTYRRPHSE